ncbi:MAG TPA: hypothetical protein VFU80_03605 [Sphingomicrobium sp.]|nr:hypothetical protein [Sphingomicrobium sp.]
MIPVPSNIGLKLVASICAVLALALLIHDRNRWKAKTEDYVELLAAEGASHDATAANYRAAAEQARRQDAENLARVKAEQAAINERTENDFQSRIAAARATAERLRRDAGSAPADRRAGGTARVPGLPAAANGASQGAGENGLSDTERLIATEQAIQLDELINWVRRQAAVDVSPAKAGVSGRKCAGIGAAAPSEMPLCAGMKASN